jgi:hypothetical protein
LREKDFDKYNNLSETFPGIGNVSENVSEKIIHAK